MKFLANFSIKNTLLVNLAFIFIVLTGVLSLKSLQREAFPNISFDTVLITAAYPGASPNEIERLITIPIETELKEVEDIDEIDSVSSEGTSIITIKLEENLSNKDQVLNDIQRAVDRAEDLPVDMPERPSVTDLKTKNKPVIEISLSGNLPENQIRTYAKSLEKKLLLFPEVARIDFNGFRDKEIWVDVTPKTLKENHLSIAEISRSLQKQNKTIPGGKFYLKNHEYLLRTTGEFKNADDVKKTIVRASTLGDWIPLKDIAHVTEGFEEETIVSKTNGSRSINLIVIKKEKGDTITLVKKIKDLINEFKPTANKNLEVSLLNDMSYYIERRQNVLINNGLIGMIMVIIALFTFLSKRTAIAACVGIPTALFLTFTFMHYLGISFNMLSMFGLIMVLGMLVDEDIVISENIYRHIENGETSNKATINGVSEVAWPLIATVLTTVAAFTPLMIMSGIMGKFVRNIPIVLTLTLFASLFQALIILPSHINHLNSGRFAPKLNKQHKAHMIWLKKHYKNILTHLIGYRYLYTLVLIICFAGLIYVAKNHLKVILFPSKGIEIIHAKIETLEGDSLETTANKIKQVENIIAKMPKKELDSFTTHVGIIQRNAHDIESKRTPNAAQIIIYLTPDPVRKKSHLRDFQTIINDLRKEVKPLKGFSRIDFESIRPGPPLGKPIQIRITGDNFPAIIAMSDLVREKLTTMEGVNDVKDDYDMSIDEYQIVIDPVMAAQTGLTVEHIASTIRNAFDGNVATKIKSSEEEINVVVKYPVNLRSDPKALFSLLIPNDKGNLIKISSVATFKKNKAVLAIKHHDGIRTINVTANLDEQITSAMTVSKQMSPFLNKIEKKNPGTSILFGGEIEETNESLSNMYHAFYMAAALILIILIAVLRSVIQPILIMITVPFSVMGIIVAFYFHKEALGFMSLMGMVGMTGVVVDSGIIMVDFINKQRQQGLKGINAIVQGAETRLRSIILTTITTFFGIIPAAYGIGGSDPFVKPMALALNYGIVSGAIITIFFLPVFLVIFEDVKNLFQHIPKSSPIPQNGI